MGEGYPRGGSLEGSEKSAPKRLEKIKELETRAKVNGFSTFWRGFPAAVCFKKLVPEGYEVMFVYLTRSTRKRGKHKPKARPLSKMQKSMAEILSGAGLDVKIY